MVNWHPFFGTIWHPNWKVQDGIYCLVIWNTSNTYFQTKMVETSRTFFNYILFVDSVENTLQQFFILNRKSWRWMAFRWWKPDLHWVIFSMNQPGLEGVGPIFSRCNPCCLQESEPCLARVVRPRQGSDGPSSLETPGRQLGFCRPRPPKTCQASFSP